MSAIIVEDGITGPPPEFSQANAYARGSSGVMGGFETFMGKVLAGKISYNHVSRKLLGGYNGQEGSLPESINQGEKHSYKFKHTLPVDWNKEYIYVVGVLLAPHGSVLNAVRSEYLPGHSYARPLFI